MIKLYETGVYLLDGKEIVCDDEHAVKEVQSKKGVAASKEAAQKGTMAYCILQSHNQAGDQDNLKIKFDALTAHDITYVGIIQTARASGMTKFPVPMVMTNCHNSLCAVGGTINEDDHMFALSAAKKYGGIYVPTNLAVIHSYNREMMSGCGKMILGSDSHTRYGALGTMAIGEGGGELAKQLVGRTYDLPRPGVIAIYLTGKPQKGVGPQDVALSIIGNVYKKGYVKNKVMEFVGDGIGGLDVEFRNGIDVMTTETTCLSSIWVTDQKVKDYFAIHGRPEAYKDLAPESIAYYEGLVYVDLSEIKPTIALPFHPSNIYTIEELKANPKDILHKVAVEGLAQFDNKNLTLGLVDKVKNGEIYVDQGIVGGCSGGTFDNIVDVASILDGHSTGNGAFTMSVYPGSQPTYLELVKNGSVAKIMTAGAVMRSAFCGPCFGAGDTPANGEFSIRHATRNFPNREGSKPTEGQLSSVALMDARSIAATAINGGKLTAATELDISYTKKPYYFDKGVYEKRVYNGVGREEPNVPLQLGPNIKDWPSLPKLTEHLLLKVVTFITDAVTTTDELIPSGETSSYRSNPLRLAEFTLSRKDPLFVENAKAMQRLELMREEGKNPAEGSDELKAVYAEIKKVAGYENAHYETIGIGATLFANKPGDGSAREQAASCQKVIGSWANIAREYATKRYRSNLINWGMLPFLTKEVSFEKGDYIFVPNIREALLGAAPTLEAYVIGKTVHKLELTLGEMTKDERQILAEGCLINYYKSIK